MTKFIKALKGWKHETVKKKKCGCEMTVLISPSGKRYRAALSWERPDLVIELFEATQDIRLVRVR